MRFPQELFAEQLWLLWVNTHGVMPLSTIQELMDRCNLKLRKQKSLQDVRLAFGRGFQHTYGNMTLAREQIATEIDKVCITCRWDFILAKYKQV